MDETEEIYRYSAGLYSQVRQLPDGTWCCLCKMIYTIGLLVDVSPHGYGHRFCFKEYAVAERELLKMQSADDEPIGYIARKP